MAQKISDELASLAVKTKGVEEKVTAARQESGEKLDKMISDTIEELESKKEIFIKHAEEINAKVNGDWDSFHESIKQKAEHIKSETAAKNKLLIERAYDKKHEQDEASAEKYYNDSIDYTLSCIEWASVALTEVESATLRAFSAKLQLDSLRQK